MTRSLSISLGYCRLSMHKGKRKQAVYVKGKTWEGIENKITLKDESKVRTIRGRVKCHLAISLLCS